MKAMKITVIIGVLLAALIATYFIGHRIGGSKVDHELHFILQRDMDKYMADRAADTIISLNEIKLDLKESKPQICLIKKLIQRRAEDWQKCTEHEACASTLQGDYYSETKPVIKSFEKIQCP